MRIYAGTYQGQIAIIQGIPTSIQLRTIKQVSQNSIRAITFVQGELVAGGYDQELRTIHLLNATQARESKQSNGIVNCILDIGNGLTAVGLDNGNIRFWDINNWNCKKVIKEHKKGISDIKMDAKGLLMVSAAGKQVIFWKIATLKSLYHYKFDFDVEHILLVDSFQYLFLLGDRTIRQVSTNENKELFRVDVNSKIQCGVIYLDFLIIATEKGQIKIWKHGNYNNCIYFQAYQGRIKGMKIINIENDNYLITAQANGQISVWDILQFLDGVDDISQDYPLEGLKSLSTIKIKQRIICIEALSISKNPKKSDELQQINQQQNENLELNEQLKKVQKVNKKKKKIHKSKKQEKVKI